MALVLLLDKVGSLSPSRRWAYAHRFQPMVLKSDIGDFSDRRDEKATPEEVVPLYDQDGLIALSKRSPYDVGFTLWLPGSMLM